MPAVMQPLTSAQAARAAMVKTDVRMAPPTCTRIVSGRLTLSPQTPSVSLNQAPRSCFGNHPAPTTIRS
jgi:hypothetical protein